MTKLDQKHYAIRVEYGIRYKPYTVDNFWQFIHFINEAYTNLSAEGTRRILKEEGTTYEPENLQYRSDLEGYSIYIVALVS